tara:strand:- start:1633 stop:2175 length:543 start_codon:yes stop_codon:yes gene_type:complete
MALPLAAPIAMGLMTSIPPLAAGVSGLLSTDKLSNLYGGSGRGMLSGTLTPLGNLLSIWDYISTQNEPPKSDWFNPDNIDPDNVDVAVEEWRRGGKNRVAELDWNKEGTKVRWVGKDRKGRPSGETKQKTSTPGATTTEEQRKRLEEEYMTRPEREAERELRGKRKWRSTDEGLETEYED